ncbi:hypothetical protein [Janibacter sp. HTCC2649]|uniref:hypothetical protein n=1 Tax=Janibacter sp. HTCC2649 TaxID=313589 RepID=UPI001ED95A40|nr:hypothetical protein [Janibacter sp. HTCC2649]
MPRGPVPVHVGSASCSHFRRGKRPITFVQAMQYWIKLTCLAVPAFVLIALWIRSGGEAPVV